MNKKYREVTIQILRAIRKIYLKSGIFSLRAKKVATEAKIAESTFYTHRREIEKILREPGIWLQENLGWLAKEQRSIDFVFRKMLASIYENKEIIASMLTMGDAVQLRKMLGVLRPFVEQCWPDYEKRRRDKIFRFCECLMIQDIIDWQRERFDRASMEWHARHLTWIVRNTPKMYNRMTAGEMLVE